MVSIFYVRTFVHSPAAIVFKADLITLSPNYTFTTAQVTDYHHRSRSYTTQLEYQFIADGMTFKGSDSVLGGSWGHTVKVYYRQDYPESNSTLRSLIEWLLLCLVAVPFLLEDMINIVRDFTKR